MSQWPKDAQDETRRLLAEKPTSTRACPVCPASSGVLEDAQCPACHRTGKVQFAPGDRIATRFLEQSSRIDPKLSTSNRRRYHVEIACKMPLSERLQDIDNVDPCAAVSIYVWAYSSERAMVAARDAAIWDWIPRPFEVTVSRSFLVEDEVIQKTRSTCDEDKGEG